MAQDNYRKIKLLKLLDMLRLETDEQHPLSTSQICGKLNAMGIICDRRTLPRDIAILNNQGYEIMSVMIGHDKCYYVEDRSFSLPELKILIDAVQAASFITDKKTTELVNKIAALGGSHRAEVLKSNMVCFNTRKHSNEQIYYNIDTLERAILNNRKVIFYYYSLDENGKKIYRRNHHHYVVEPVALVFNEDNYYLISYSSRHDGTANYRVDRMETVEIIEETICDRAISLRDSVSRYTEQAFKMYGGEAVEITLEFADSLTGVIFDKFGEDIKMCRLSENECTATVTVQISPIFWGWLFQLTNQMKLIAPQSLVEIYKKKTQEVYEMWF